MKMQKHYDLVSKEMGYKVSPPELNVNGLGYFAMNSKQYAIAASLFKMNIDNYPNSSNTYDSYGDLLAAEKDTANAIANYKKAMSLQANPATQQKLDALEGKDVFKLTPQELKKYSGVFDLDTLPLTITIELRNDELWASVPGEGDFQLVPLSANTFTVKNLSGYEVHFQMEGDKVAGFTSIQPNGTFKAHLKK
jgi:tetratricopeptide (TPR) repeat protein